MKKNPRDLPITVKPKPVKDGWTRLFHPVLLAGGCSLLAIQALAQNRSWPENILQQSFGISTQAQIDAPIDEVYQGCARRDCIPSIDAPGFVSAAEATQMEDEDLILGLESADTVRAYPAFILNHHEVVNDSVDGVAVAITYCPLCGSGVAFQRETGGQILTFGVSGLLHNSDLILYDRETESLWQQITGIAIAGPGRGRCSSPCR